MSVLFPSWTQIRSCQMHVELNSYVLAVVVFLRVLQCLYPKKDFQALGCIGGRYILGGGWFPNHIFSAHLPALTFSNTQLPHWHLGLEEERPERLCPFWDLLHQLFDRGNLPQIALAQQLPTGLADTKLWLQDSWPLLI